MTMITPEFSIHFRRHLPKAPHTNLKDVSTGEVSPKRGSMEFTQKQTMDALPKKRLTPEVVAMLLSMELGSEDGEALSRRKKVAHEINSTKYGTKMAAPDEASKVLSNCAVPPQGNTGIVDIVKSSGQPLGFSLRECNGSETEKAGGIFVSRLTAGGIVEQNSLLSAGDEILEINYVPVHGYKLSDVVAMIQIPKRLALKVRFREGPRHTSAARNRTEHFAGKPVLLVNNNNIYDISKTDQSQRADNKRTGTTHGGAHPAQGKVETNREAIPAPNTLTFRRNSSGRILPAPPDSESDKLRYPTSGVEDRSSLGTSKPQPSTVSIDGALRTGPNQVKDTNVKLSNRKSDSSAGSTSKHKNRKKSAVLPISTTETRRNSQVKVKLDGSGQESSVVGAMLDASDGGGQVTSGVGSKRVDPGDIRFDIITTNGSTSDGGIFSRTLEDVKVECKRDITPRSSPPDLRKTSTAEAFGSSSSLSSSDSPKSQRRRPIETRTPRKLGDTGLSRSEMRMHSSRSADVSPVSSSAESEDQISKNIPNNGTKRDTEQKPPLFLHSHSSDELNQPHNSWFSKIGNQKRKHVRKFSEGAQLRAPPKGTGEAYRLQEPTDCSSDDVDPGYRLYPSNASGSGSRNTPRAVTGMLALHIVKGCRISPGEPVSKDKRKKFKVFCTVDSDGIRQACTGTKKGSNDFQWNESFEIEFQRTREIKISIWMRSKKDGDRTLSEGCLCLAQLRSEGGEHMLAVCLEPCGTLYVKLQFTDMKVLLQRTPSQKNEGVFGFPLETVLRRESSRIPIIVRKCVEEINGRGLEITGIYRLCGNAAKKRALRTQFENSSANVDLAQTENPVDVNIITGLLKDYLRELPYPLLSQEVREILCEASATEARCESNADQLLVNQITKKFLVTSRATIKYLLDHFATVLMNSDLNKMDSHNLAVCVGPVLLCPSLGLGTTSANAVSDTKKDISAIKLLLEIWPKPEQVSAC